ncbi:3324_t:CDS:2, partial [Paraglomus occultum]
VSVGVFGNNICLSHSNTSHSEEEMKMGYNIVRYGRPLWQSMWNGMTYDVPRERYRYLVDIAITKLCGGTLNWEKHWQRSATALMACTICIYICPLSRMARDLVKSHMATIITAEDSGKKHLIGYPSEPMLSEGALTLLSRPGVELDVLKELDLVGKEGGVIDTGNRGELCARILLLSARRQQILSFREENCENYPTFSAHQLVTAYLCKLFSSEFPHEKFQHLAAYDIGFTHFIALDHTPDESTLQLCWDRGAAIIYQRNQPGADIALVMCHRDEKKLAVLNIQVKNHARPESRGVRNYAVANGLRTSMTLCKTCAHLEDSSVGIYIQIGEAYANKPKFETYYYGEGRNRHGNMTFNFSSDAEEANRLVVLGLSCFKLDQQYHEVIRSLLQSWIDISMICRPTEFKFLCRMFPVVYGSHATKRAKEINNDNDEDAKDYLINKRWKSDEQVEQDEEWSEEYE